MSFNLSESCGREPIDSEKWERGGCSW